MLEQEEDRPWCVRQSDRQVSTEQEVGEEQQARRSEGGVRFAEPVVYDTAQSGQNQPGRIRELMCKLILGGL